MAWMVRGIGINGIMPMVILRVRRGRLIRFPPAQLILLVMGCGFLTRMVRVAVYNTARHANIYKDKDAIDIAHSGIVFEDLAQFSGNIVEGSAYLILAEEFQVRHFQAL